MMKSTLLSLMALGVAVAMAGPADRALAGEPFELSAAQMDSVTGGELLVIVTPKLTSGRDKIEQTIMAPVGGSIMINLETRLPLREIGINPPVNG